MGTKKFPLVTFPKTSSLSKWYEWRHTLTLSSDAVTSFWWDLRVKFMSISLVSIQWGVSLFLRKVSWRLFFCFQCFRGQEIHSSYWQMPDLDGRPWNSRSRDFYMTIPISATIPVRTTKFFGFYGYLVQGTQQNINKTQLEYVMSHLMLHRFTR